MRLIRICLFAVIIVVVAACGVTSNEQQTMEAFDATHSARLANLYASATFEIERLVITQEHLNNQLERADEAQGDMRSTLEERGIDTSDLPDVVTPAPQTENNGNNDDTRPIVTPGTLQPSRVAVTPIATEASTVIENSPLTNVVMARTVGDDDCAQDITSQFTAQDSQIYVVATANNLPAGTNVTSRWLRDTQELSSFTVSFEFDIEQACIWFFADQTDFEFAAGNYTVELYVGNDLAAATSYSIAPTTS